MFRALFILIPQAVFLWSNVALFYCITQYIEALPKLVPFLENQSLWTIELRRNSAGHRTLTWRVRSWYCNMTLLAQHVILWTKASQGKFKSKRCVSEAFSLVSTLFENTELIYSRLIHESWEI